MGHQVECVLSALRRRGSGASLPEETAKLRGPWHYRRMPGTQSVGFRRVTVGTITDGLFNVIVTAKVRKLGERRPQRWKLHIHPTDPKAAAYVRNDGEVKWNLNDLDVATVEEMNPEGAMEVQNLRALGMGWAWYYVNDLVQVSTGC